MRPTLSSDRKALHSLTSCACTQFQQYSPPLSTPVVYGSISGSRLWKFGTNIKSTQEFTANSISIIGSYIRALQQTTGANAEMVDPLSIAGSVAGLLTISSQIVGMAKELFDKVKDAPETMMRVREEVESMQPIFFQVQLFLRGGSSGLNHNNLTMISVHNLMATLTGCVIVYSRLEKKVNDVCGFNDPTTATAAWKRAGVVANRVKWGLWRHEEVLGIIEDLQRQKLSLNLMLTIITW